jgi:hypothetical protein
MKYIKLFMLMAVVVLFASCSDDEVNTTSGTTVEFAETSAELNENGEILQIPIKVKGVLNGKVTFNIVTTETGDTPAKDETNYSLTTKNFNVEATGDEESTVYVEVTPKDDYNQNADRTFSITIENVQGATLGANKTINVTIVDNDKSYYTIFGGQWKFSGTYTSYYTGVETSDDFVCDMTIGAASDPDNEDYEYFLQAYISSFQTPCCPLSMTLSFPLRYKYNENTKKGTLEIPCNTDIYTYDLAGYLVTLEWQWRNFTSGSPTTNALRASWTPTEDLSVPDVIEFPEDAALQIVELAGSYYTDDVITNIKMTRK